MAVDSRDQIWAAVYDTWYRCAYNRLLADRLVGRWQSIDDVTKVVVALTASGSVVAGWALWTQSGFRLVWLGLAGLGAILSIINSALGVPSRLKDWANSKSQFGLLEIELETCRWQMRIDPDFSIEDYSKRYEEFRKRFGEAVNQLRSDFLATARLAQACQRDLDERLNQDASKNQAPTA